MNWSIVFYAVIICIYRLTQFYAIIKSKNLYKPDYRGNMAIYLVWVPIFFVLIGAPYEHYILQQEQNYFWIVLGTLLVLIAAVLRGKGLSDMTLNFFVFKDKQAKVQLITEGIYQYLRHPLYLANIFLMLGCAIFWFSKMALIITVIGIIGIVINIYFEEQELQQAFADFEDYKLKTAKLIPKIF